MPTNWAVFPEGTEPPKPVASVQPKPPPPPAFEPMKFSAEALPPMAPHGPMAAPPVLISQPMMSQPEPIKYAESALLKDPKVGDLPPVTLQLLKQSVMFDTEADCIANIGRTLGIPPSQAAEIRAAIIAAFPDLKPAQIYTRPPQGPSRPARR